MDQRPNLRAAKRARARNVASLGLGIDLSLSTRGPLGEGGSPPPSTAGQPIGFLLLLTKAS